MRLAYLNCRASGLWLPAILCTCVRACRRACGLKLRAAPSAHAHSFAAPAEGATAEFHHILRYEVRAQHSTAWVHAMHGHMQAVLPLCLALQMLFFFCQMRHQQRVSSCVECACCCARPAVLVAESPTLLSAALSLAQYGVNCTIRAEKGQDISGACGQLVLEHGGRLSTSGAAGSGNGCGSKAGLADVEDLLPPPVQPRPQQAAAAVAAR